MQCFVVVRAFLVNTQTFLGEDKCSEVGDGIEQSEDAELQPLLPLLLPTAPAPAWPTTAGGGPSSETRRPPPTLYAGWPASLAAATADCLVVVVVDLVVVLVTSHRLTELFTLLLGVVAAEVGVAAVANIAAAATAAPLHAGIIVSGVVGAAKYCAPPAVMPADAYLVGVAGAAATLFTCSCIYVCSMA